MAENKNAKTPTDDGKPVAWRWKERINSDFDSWVITSSEPPPYAIAQQPLYTASTPCQTCQSLAMAVMNDQTYHEKVIPKRTWVGLTDDEIAEVISGQFAERNYWVKITKALEAKLKEKNT